MKVREDEVQFPDGSQGIYGVIEKPDAAIIIPKLNDKYLMIRLYRYTIDAIVWEFPHGAVEVDQLSAEDIARQELEEETGYRAGSMQFLRTLHIAYGYSNQVVHVFAADDLVEGEQRLEAGEVGMEMKTFFANEIDAMIASGELTDTQSIAAWAIWRKQA